MKRSMTIACVVAGVSGSLAAMCSAQPLRYRMERVGWLSGAGNGPDTAYAIDAGGRVVGFQSRQLGMNIRAHGYVWDSPGIVELQPLGPNFATAARGVSPSGLIVGYAETADSPSTIAAAVLSATGPTVIGTLGGSSGMAYDMNSSGLIVGDSRTPSGDSHAFWIRWPGGTMTDLGTLGGDLSRVEAVNDADLMVGQSRDTAGVFRAIAATPGSGMVDLNSVIPPLSGWSLTDAHDVNASGKIVGVGALNGASASFVYDSASGGVPVEVSPLAASNRAYATAINSSGVIVGNCTTVQGKFEGGFRATVWVNGEARELSKLVVGNPGLTLEFAPAINDAGQIVVINVIKKLFARLTPLCPSDTDGDGFVTGDDFDLFVDLFVAGGAGADFNEDGFVTGVDLDAYLDAFESGC